MEDKPKTEFRRQSSGTKNAINLDASMFVKEDE